MTLHYFHFLLSVCSQGLAPILLLSVYNQCTAHLTITVEDFITNTSLLQLFIFICLEFSSLSLNYYNGAIYFFLLSLNKDYFTFQYPNTHKTIDPKCKAQY